MGLEDDFGIIDEKDTQEVVCQKYDALRNKKMEMIYEGKQEKMLLPYILLYTCMAGR